MGGLSKFWVGKTENKAICTFICTVHRVKKIQGELFTRTMIFVR